MYFLVVGYQQLFNVPTDSSADRIQVPIHLGVVGRFVTVEIAPQEEQSNQQDHKAYDEEHAQARAARLKLPPSQVPFPERGSSVFLAFRPRYTFLGLGLFRHAINALSTVERPVRQT